MARSLFVLTSVGGFVESGLLKINAEKQKSQRHFEADNFNISYTFNRIHVVVAQIIYVQASLRLSFCGKDILKTGLL